MSWPTDDRQSGDLHKRIDEIDKRLQSLQLGKLAKELDGHVERLGTQVEALRKKRDWFSFASTAILQVATGAITVAVAVLQSQEALERAKADLDASIAVAKADVTKLQATEYHRLFRQALEHETSEETRLAALAGICQQSAEPGLAETAKLVMVGLESTCWDTCQPRIQKCVSACQKSATAGGGETCQSDCEDRLACDEVCTLYSCLVRDKPSADSSSSACKANTASLCRPKSLVGRDAALLGANEPHPAPSENHSMEKQAVDLRVSPPN
jgi:hypothetical protein